VGGLLYHQAASRYYKFALAVMNVVLMPVTAMLSSAAPEVNRLVATRAWGPLRKLLRRTSIMALAWTGVCTAGIATLGYFLLGYLKQGLICRLSLLS